MAQHHLLLITCNIFIAALCQHVLQYLLVDESHCHEIVIHRRMKPEYEDVAVTSELLTNDGRIKLTHYPNYLLFGRGPLATTGCDRGAFVNTRGKLGGWAYDSKPCAWQGPEL